jgi:hypothetical protein
VNRETPHPITDGAALTWAEHGGAVPGDEDLPIHFPAHDGLVAVQRPVPVAGAVESVRVELCKTAR